MYVMQPYGFDKAKIAAIIIGVCSLGVGFTTFLLLYFYWEELILATIFLTIFLSAGLICIIVAIIRHLGRRQPYYWSTAQYYPQSPTAYQAPPQPAQSYDYAQRPAEAGQPHQHYEYQTPPQYVPQQPAQWYYSQPYQPNLQNVWNYPQRCPLCNNPARYAESYQRWYCERCNQWI